MTTLDTTRPDLAPDTASAMTNLPGRLKRYGWAFLLLVVAHVLSTLLWSTLGAATHTIFLAAVVIASLFGGYGPGLFATALAGLDLIYVFIPPYYSFTLDLDESVFVVSFVGVAVLISLLQERRRTAEISLRKERESLERRVTERTAELISSQEQLKVLVNDLVTVAEREQQRIGRDLHDGLGQELTGISLISSALAERIKLSDAAAGLQAEQVAGLVRQSIRYTRDLARGLCPVDLEDEGLASALTRLAERISRLPDVTCTLSAETGIGEEGDFDQQTSIHLYRVAQEAINNALRHGRAKKIDIVLRSEDDRWSLSVSDNGSGFAAADAPEGMGRRLMQYRAGTIGATLDIRPGDRGVCVTCTGAYGG